jgi:hypothetical protein
MYLIYHTEGRNLGGGVMLRQDQYLEYALSNGRIIGEYCIGNYLEGLGGNLIPAFARKVKVKVKLSL